MPPSELLESGWPARIKGEILPPSDLEVSCTSGRLIDYAVCHRSIANIARLSSFVEGPWKTHQALMLTLPRSPGRFLTRSLVISPAKFLRLDRNVGSGSWSDFIHQSKSLHFQSPCIPLPTHLDPDLTLSQKLALKYNVGQVRPKDSFCQSVRPRSLTRVISLGEVLRQIFVSNPLSSESHPLKNILLIKNAVSGLDCFHA